MNFIYLVEKAKESTEKSKLLKKNCDEISFAKENYRRIKRDMLKIK
jgi:hypothetical protein